MQLENLHDGQCLRVPLSVLKKAPWGNVRQGKRNQTKFERLKESIQQNGVVSAITCRLSSDEEKLEVLAGYGRWEASEALGKDDIPVVIKDVSDQEGMAIGLAENLDREDMSVVDEIKVSQRFVSLYDADYKEAADRLGWPERKLRARIELNKCSESVLEALGEGTIKIGHAEILCQFTDKLQNGTLAKILDEEWTVEYLKERANRANRLLRHAKFDTADCQHCPHNSSVQASLFDNSVGDAKCGNLPCYREKSEAWVTEFRVNLESEEGKVFLSEEKPESDRKTVSEEVVGEDAFTNDCLSCEKRVRILQGGINKDCGTVIDNQCIGLGCLKKKIAALEAPKASSKKGGKAPTRRTATAKDRKPTIPKGVTEQARAFARQTLGGELVDVEAFRLALSLYAISNLGGYKVFPSHENAIATLAKKGVESLTKEIDKAIRFATLESAESNYQFKGTDVVIKAQGQIDDPAEVLTRSWVPTKDWLSAYQKGGLESFCKQRNVGFQKHYDETNGKGAFSKLMKKTKAQIIEEILGSDFDWSGVLPKEVSSLVSSKK